MNSQTVTPHGGRATYPSWPASLPPRSHFADRAHGTRLRYVSGCRRVPCRAANSRYESGRLRARRQGDWNGCVSAAKARRYLRRLQRKGLGRRRIAVLSGVPQSTLVKIRRGVKQQIRARTERKILAVPVAPAFGQYIDAGQTWAFIEALRRAGFSKAELARRLGKATPALQLKRDRVTVRNALLVKWLYGLVMRGAAA